MGLGPKKFVVILVSILLSSVQISSLVNEASLNSDPVVSAQSKASAERITPPAFVVRAGHPHQQLPITNFEAAIRTHSRAHGLDWRLVLAVMKQESQFREDARSYRGARGLMQIMPTTETELARKFGVEDLSHPHKNIRGGVYYLATLYDLFDGAPEEDRLKLSLAAYNSGPGRIYDAQELAAYLGDDPYSWSAIQNVLPLLSKRYYTLHQSVWPARPARTVLAGGPQSGFVVSDFGGEGGPARPDYVGTGGRPRNGYFGKSRQTIAYVQKVVENYEHYRQILDFGVCARSND